jgi:hypothetical protein
MPHIGENAAAWISKKESDAAFVDRDCADGRVRSSMPLRDARPQTPPALRVPNIREDAAGGVGEKQGDLAPFDRDCGDSGVGPSMTL